MSCKIKGLFCKRALSKKLFLRKRPVNLKEPTNRSHPAGNFYIAFSDELSNYRSLLQQSPIKETISAKETYNFEGAD